MEFLSELSAGSKVTVCSVGGRLMQRRLSELGIYSGSRLEVVRNSGLAERLGRERLLFNARAAIERYQALETKQPHEQTFP